MPESDVEAALERLREAHRWPLHFVGQVDAFQREWPIIERHIAEQTRKLDGYARECMEVDQSLGKALGYPWYKDDPVNFPDATEADGVCTGEHVPGSIAAEAANRIKAQAQEIERLRGLLREHGACRMCSGRGDRAMCMCDGQTCRANCHSNERPCYYCKGTGLQEWAAAALAGEAKP